MSSCPSESDEKPAPENPESQELASEVRVLRETEIRDKAKEFLRGVVLNLCSPEGLSGKVDIAFKVNRQQILGEILIELGKELIDGSEDSVQAP